MALRSKPAASNCAIVTTPAAEDGKQGRRHTLDAQFVTNRNTDRWIPTPRRV